MTESTKNKIFNILKNNYPDGIMTDIKIRKAVNEIADLIDHEVGNALLEATDMRGIMKAVGLKLVSEDTNENNIEFPWLLWSIQW